LNGPRMPPSTSAIEAFASFLELRSEPECGEL
jgi:hypothetical protein